MPVHGLHRRIIGCKPLKPAKCLCPQDILEASRQEDTRRTQSAGFLSKLRKGKP